ncbi:protein kinase [Strigomonas culicis]|uniref:Protein kinase n=1 Tax=Strigomonas culicis TaxID=28005 RepID=S9U9S0_9TRYP|nr:protein kinase [Strigomonas culicis]|eukprot:EPY25504.1 protein kinase [Strigomonas culicis]
MPYVDVSAPAERMHTMDQHNSQHTTAGPSHTVGQAQPSFQAVHSVAVDRCTVGDVSLGLSQACALSDPTASTLDRVFLRNPDADSVDESESDDEEFWKLVSEGNFYELDPEHILSLRKSIPSSSFSRTAETPVSSRQDDSDMDGSSTSLAKEESAHFQLRSFVMIAVVMCFCVAFVALFAFLPMYFLCNRNNKKITEFLLSETTTSVSSVTENSVAMLPMFVGVIAYNYVRRQVSTSDLISIPDDPEGMLLSFVGVLERLNTSLQYLRFIYTNATYVNVAYTNASSGGTGVLGAMNTTPSLSTYYALDTTVTDVNESTPVAGTYNFADYLDYSGSPYNLIVVPWNETGSTKRWVTSTWNISGIYFNYVFPFIVDDTYLGMCEAGMPNSYLNIGLERVMSLLGTHGRFGIVDAHNDIVLMNSWGQEVVTERWDTECNCTVYDYLSVYSVTDPIFNAGARYVRNHGGSQGVLKVSGLITFQTDDGEEALLALTEVKNDAGLDIVLFAIVQKSDFQGDFGTARTVVIVVTVVVFVFAAGIALLLASSLDRPLKRMIPALERASDLVLSRSDADAKRSSCLRRLFNGEFIFEIRDLQMAFEKLGASLRELKSYVPQAMLTGESDSVDLEESMDSLTGYRGERLNKKKVKGKTNDFVSCTCSMVLLEVRAEIAAEMYVYLMNTFSFHAKENQGCVEELGQNNVLVSFGGHHRISMSQKRAFRFAVDMYADIPVELRDYVVMLLEYGDFAKGSCSAKDRCSYMVFGTAHMSEEARVLWEIGCHLATTLTFKRSIEDNKSLQEEGDVPQRRGPQTDDLEIIPIERMLLSETNQQVILCEIVLPDKYADPASIGTDVSTWISGFTEMLSGSYSEALSYFDRIGGRLNSRQYDRLVTICKQRIANGERGPYYYPKADPYNFCDLSDAANPLGKQAPDDAADSRTAGLSRVSDHGPVVPMANASCSSNVFGFFDCNVSKTSVDGSHTEMNATLPLRFKDIDGREWFRSVDKVSEGAFGSVYKCMSTEGVQAAVKHLSRVSYNVNDEHLLSEMDVFLQCRNKLH